MTHTVPITEATPNLAVEGSPKPLTLTPREWRRILEDPSFLARPDNRYQQPRRLNGRPVEIVRV
ncbi:MAG TPA: hypothetical protein VG407_06785 [Caulobacteraceae bacterium]|nr:hypothetical protein [Caulobacteraceae bacterium]